MRKSKKSKKATKDVDLEREAALPHESIFMFDRQRLNNGNGFIFGVPGNGMSFIAKVDTCINFCEDADNNTLLNGGDDSFEKRIEKGSAGCR